MAYRSIKIRGRFGHSVKKNNRTAIDNDINTIYQSSNKDLIVRLGKRQNITEVTYFPAQENNGLATRYKLYISNDGKKWTLANQGEFSNIIANPIAQTIAVKKPQKARYVKLSASSLAEGTKLRIAEIGIQ